MSADGDVKAGSGAATPKDQTAPADEQLGDPVPEPAIIEITTERTTISGTVGSAKTGSATAVDDEAAEAPPITESAHVIRDRIADYLGEMTHDGLFPVVAWGADLNGDPSKLGLLTCPIPDFPTAVDLTERYLAKSNRQLVPGRYIPLATMWTIGEKNRVMTPVAEAISGLDTRLQEHRRIINRLVAYCTASRFRNRAFMLVDIVGFSTMSTPEQLALRMSLGQSINQCKRRMQYLYERELVLQPQFNRISTGDGCYVWNWSPAPESAVATFVLMTFLMTQSEALRERSNLRLRAGFGIGEAYIFPYEGPGIFPRAGAAEQGFMPDAIGPVLNNLQRLVSVAAPGQILVEEFDQPGREERHGERLDVDTMLTRVRSEILPAELSTREPIKPHDIVLKVEPASKLRITDKHKMVHHCYNVWGKIPNRLDGTVRLQTIGVVPDPAPEITDVRFRG